MRGRLPCIAALLACVMPAVHAAPAPRALVLQVADVIGPASADFVVRGIARAEREHDEVVVLELDTPGGLDQSMRVIIQRMLSASVPVVVYVAPRGARAASAGTYILYAAQVAAMAPGTNLGAATPVQIGAPGLPSPAPGGKQPETQGRNGGGKRSDGASDGGTMEHKLVNDAAAYIRSLAQLRGRNAQWAEHAVREAASLSANDALAEHVVDLVADDVPALLARLDGRTVHTAAGTRVLHTRGIVIERLAPDWRNRLLSIITNPNVAYVLMLLGVYGLFFEIAQPGAVLPGVAGAISLLLAMYAFHVLPVNYAGLALILMGIAFMIAEAFVASFGALGIGGAIAFVAGSLMLMNTGAPGFTLSLPLVAVFTASSALFFISIMVMALRQRRRPVTTGREQMLGARGEALDDVGRDGHVRVHGEVWFARAGVPVRRGDAVRVTGMDGLVLEVEPLAKEED